MHLLSLLPSAGQEDMTTIAGCSDLHLRLIRPTLPTLMHTSHFSQNNTNTSRGHVS